MKGSYHHGNLKNELLETGIRLLSTEGIESFSLRKLAVCCGVSHNAVYRHFPSKEAMLEACRAHVRDGLTAYLRAAQEPPLSPEERICALARAYFAFYRTHPSYYSVLFRNSSVKIRLTLDETGENDPPFEEFRQAFCALSQAQGLTAQEAQRRLIRFWALLQGAVSLAVSPNVLLQSDAQTFWNDNFEPVCNAFQTR